MAKSRARGRFMDTGARYNTAALASIAAHVEGLSEKSIQKANNRALASVRRRFEPAAKRALREVYNVRVSDLSEKFQVRAGSSGGGEHMSLFASTRKLPLVGFGGRWRGRKSKGATAEIQKGARKEYEHSFVARFGGRNQILVRQFSRDATTPSGRDPRNKLRILTGASAFQMVMGEDNVIAARLSREMNEFRGTELLRQLELARKKTRRG